MSAQNLISACLSRLDDLEAIIYSLSDDAHLRMLRNSLTTIVDDYTALLDDEISFARNK